MYRELIGDNKFFKRINFIFSKFYNKSISSKTFIEEMVNDKQRKEKRYLKKFFNDWIYKRDIPRLTYSVNIKNNTASVVFEQTNTDFIFPVKIIIETIRGRVSRKVTIKKKIQEFIFIKKNDIKKIKVEKNYSPVYLKEVKNDEKKRKERKER
jgi:aminopeptidase N